MKRLRGFTWLVISCLFTSFTAPCLGEPAVLDIVSREVCLDIGVRAEISGLDDITLTTSQGDGEGSALYSGADTFFLESNAPVRLILSAAPINNGLNTLATEYLIDGVSDLLETAGTGSHSGNHSIEVTSQLGSISDQLAGSYSSTLLITVVPQIPQFSQCAENQQTIEPTLEKIPAEIQLNIEPAPGSIENDPPLTNNLSPMPAWATRVMDQPGADAMFPFLSQYRLWLNGQLPTLSEQAQNWWLFPIDARLLERLGINLLNKR